MSTRCVVLGLFPVNRLQHPVSNCCAAGLEVDASGHLPPVLVERQLIDFYPNQAFAKLVDELIERDCFDGHYDPGFLDREIEIGDRFLAAAVEQPGSKTLIHQGFGYDGVQFMI